MTAFQLWAFKPALPGGIRVTFASNPLTFFLLHSFLPFLHTYLSFQGLLHYSCHKILSRKHRVTSIYIMFDFAGVWFFSCVPVGFAKKLIKSRGTQRFVLDSTSHKHSKYQGITFHWREILTAILRTHEQARPAVFRLGISLDMVPSPGLVLLIQLCRARRRSCCLGVCHLQVPWALNQGLGFQLASVLPGTSVRLGKPLTVYVHLFIKYSCEIMVRDF